MLSDKFYPKDKGNRFLRNVDICLLNHKTRITEDHNLNTHHQENLKSQFSYKHQ